MYSLARFSLLEMTECSAVLRQLSEQSSSLKELTARTVDYLYSILGDSQTGVRDCVLVRCFKTISYSRLDSATQQIARENLAGITPSPIPMGEGGVRATRPSMRNTRAWSIVVNSLRSEDRASE